MEINKNNPVMSGALPAPRGNTGPHQRRNASAQYPVNNPFEGDEALRFGDGPAIPPLEIPSAGPSRLPRQAPRRNLAPLHATDSAAAISSRGQAASQPTVLQLAAPHGADNYCLAMSRRIRAESAPKPCRGGPEGLDKPPPYSASQEQGAHAFSYPPAAAAAAAEHSRRGNESLPQARQSKTPSSIYSEHGHNDAFVEPSPGAESQARVESPIPLLSRDSPLPPPSHTTSSDDKDPFVFDSSPYARIMSSGAHDEQPRRHKRSDSAETVKEAARHHPVDAAFYDAAAAQAVAADKHSEPAEADKRSGLVRPRNDGLTDADWQTVTTGPDAQFVKGTSSSVADVSDVSDFDVGNKDNNDHYSGNSRGGFASSDRIVSPGSPSAGRPRSYNLLAAEFSDGGPGPEMAGDGNLNDDARADAVRRDAGAHDDHRHGKAPARDAYKPSAPCRVYEHRQDVDAQQRVAPAQDNYVYPTAYHDAAGHWQVANLQEDAGRGVPRYNQSEQESRDPHHQDQYGREAHRPEEGQHPIYKYDAQGDLPRDDGMTPRRSDNRREVAPRTFFKDSMDDVRQWIKYEVQLPFLPQAPGTYVSLHSDPHPSEFSEAAHQQQQQMSREPTTPEAKTRAATGHDPFQGQTPEPTTIRTPARRNRDFTIDARFTPGASVDEHRFQPRISDDQPGGSTPFRSPAAESPGGYHRLPFDLVSLDAAAQAQRTRINRGEEDHTASAKRFADQARARADSVVTAPLTPRFPISKHSQIPRIPSSPETVWFPSPRPVASQPNIRGAHDDAFVNVDLNENQTVTSLAILGNEGSTLRRQEPQPRSFFNRDEPEPARERGIRPALRKFRSKLFKTASKTARNSGGFVRQQLFARDDIELGRISRPIPLRTVTPRTVSPPGGLWARQDSARFTTARFTTARNEPPPGSMPNNRDPSEKAIGRRRLLFIVMLLIVLLFPFIGLFAVCGIFNSTISWITRGELSGWSRSQRYVLRIQLLLEMIFYTVLIIVIAINYLQHQSV
ncbi:hypothetical protein ESCO_000325 [Escovopsis weberi]|uniref:Uncharacterized protein n=1 Tax=Escovopsis weberi TaxID=150374 RepID=A0A0M8MW36_ESCWE|nr:hypothetical protein ESCO_000325 [Escovopsis weberi]